MVVTQHRSRKKPTGAKYKSSRAKRKYEIGRRPTMTKIGNTKSKTIRLKGGLKKTRLLSVDTVNLLDPKTKKFSKAKIKNSVENTANRHFIRRNILTKGAVIETEKGRAKITNRPGQEGTVNAVLV